MSIQPVHFLLVFDHSAGELLRCQTYEDVDVAMTEYALEERRHDKGSRIEVVLIGSDSLETVRRTHGSYFRDGVSKIENRLKDLGVLEAVGG